MTKVCNDCGQSKDVSAFHKDSRHGYRSQCKQCRAAHGDKYADPSAPASALLEPKPGESFEADQSGDSMVIESKSARIRTVEEALAKGGVDLNVWLVDRTVVNSYEVAMKLDMDGSGTAETCHVEPLWQVKVFLKRRAPKPFQDAAAAMIERMCTHSPKYPKVTYAKSRKPHMLEVCLFDAHFGKLAWAMETGENYDLKIAESVYLLAVQDLIAKASHYEIEKFIFPIGQDFFHVNNRQGTTLAGTPQDTDDRLFKVFDVGCAAVIKAVEYCAAVAPVEVPWVPGNHDPDTSWFMARYVGAWFRNSGSVAVDTTPTTRKFITYGENGILLTHGDSEKHRDLPAIMASENREAWGRTKYNEVHTGHFHKRKQVSYCGADTFGGGVVVRTLPSLSSSDAWHYRSGYVKSPRAAEAYLWGRAAGLEAYFCSNVLA